MQMCVLERQKKRVSVCFEMSADRSCWVSSSTLGNMEALAQGDDGSRETLSTCRNIVFVENKPRKTSIAFYPNIYSNLLRVQILLSHIAVLKKCIKKAAKIPKKEVKV